MCNLCDIYKYSFSVFALHGCFMYALYFENKKFVVIDSDFYNLMTTVERWSTRPPRSDVPGIIASNICLRQSQSMFHYAASTFYSLEIIRCKTKMSQLYFSLVVCSCILAVDLTSTILALA